MFKIGDFEIGSKVFVIAEMSANHGHDINIAKATIKAAKEAGADAIKFQTYTADTMTIDCDNEYFVLNIGSVWDGRTLYNLYEEAYTPWEWQEELFNYAREVGIICFSTPFDKTSVDFLENLNTPAYKVASFEIGDIPLIEYIASKGKPVIISTGMATLSDIENAVNACKKMGNNNIILLKCTSSYPAKIEDANLSTIHNMKDTFDVVVGLSDHTLSSVTAVVSVAFGAKVVEKHFIIDKSIGGPDCSFSIEKGEFAKMVEDIRNAEMSIGTVNYDLKKSKDKNIQVARSLFAVEDIKCGEMMTEKNVKSIRPGFGLAPINYEKVLKMVARKDIKRGTPISFQLLEEK